MAIRVLKVLLSVLVGVVAVGCGNPAHLVDDLEPAQGMKNTLVVLPYGTQGAFWNKFREGAEHAAREGQYTLQWEVPPPVFSARQQAEIVRNVTKQGPRGIIICPVHRNRLHSSLSAAADLGIAVVSAISSEDTPNQLAYVGSDNDALGRDLGQWVAQKTPANGTIAVMQTQPGMRSADARSREMMAALRGRRTQQIDFPYDRDMNVSEENLQNVLGVSLEKYLEEQGTVASVVALDEDSTMAAWNVLSKRDRDKRPQLFGVSVEPALIEACKRGEIGVIIEQDPYQMAELSIQSIIGYTFGKRPKPQIFVPYKIIRAEN